MCMERPVAAVGTEVELFESSVSGLRAQAASAAQEMLRQGHRTLTIGLDNLSAVGDAVVAAVIVALRIVREYGGTICLRTQNSEHRHQLILNGLDRLVAVVG